MEKLKCTKSTIAKTKANPDVRNVRTLFKDKAVLEEWISGFSQVVAFSIVQDVRVTTGDDGADTARFVLPFSLTYIVNAIKEQMKNWVIQMTRNEPIDRQMPLTLCTLLQNAVLADVTDDDSTVRFRYDFGITAEIEFVYDDVNDKIFGKGGYYEVIKKLPLTTGTGYQSHKPKFSLTRGKKMVVYETDLGANTYVRGSVEDNLITGVSTTGFDVLDQGIVCLPFATPAVSSGAHEAFCMNGVTIVDFPSAMTTLESALFAGQLFLSSVSDSLPAVNSLVQVRCASEVGEVTEGAYAQYITLVDKEIVYLGTVCHSLFYALRLLADFPVIAASTLYDQSSGVVAKIVFLDELIKTMKAGPFQTVPVPNVMAEAYQANRAVFRGNDNEKLSCFTLILPLANPRTTGGSSVPAKFNPLDTASYLNRVVMHSSPKGLGLFPKLYARFQSALQVVTAPGMMLSPIVSIDDTQGMISASLILGVGATPRLRVIDQETGYGLRTLKVQPFVAAHHYCGNGYVASVQPGAADGVRGITGPGMENGHGLTATGSDELIREVRHLLGVLEPVGRNMDISVTSEATDQYQTLAVFFTPSQVGSANNDRLLIVPAVSMIDSVIANKMDFGCICRLAAINWRDRVVTGASHRSAPHDGNIEFITSVSGEVLAGMMTVAKMFPCPFVVPRDEDDFSESTAAQQNLLKHGYRRFGIVDSEMYGENICLAMAQSVVIDPRSGKAVSVLQKAQHMVHKNGGGGFLGLLGPLLGPVSTIASNLLPDALGEVFGLFGEKELGKTIGGIGGGIINAVLPK